jgi:radical SAM superfamily enzyme
MTKEAGIEISEFIILGLGGRALWEEHALETAKVLNQINPDYIRIRTIIVKDGSTLKKRMKDGEYQLQSEEEYVLEHRLLIENLENIDSYYSNEHSMNLMLGVDREVARG